MAKKTSFMDKLSELIADYEEDDISDLEEEEDYEDENEDTEPFMIRMTKCYNFLVDAVEYMPVSSSKEFKFIKDQQKAKSFFLKISALAKDYHDFLNRMKQVTGA